ncbi:MAG: ATP-dependent carboxylate-amine ligase [Alphaproteobacteria bacterium HGW-Alphaproteobacteria-15]|nr:MAG: ATP-dependent carboxylate-amine ligase [Alphaproteobacteria bacterium HGW-Alphaproteobacteria-15]
MTVLLATNKRDVTTDFIALELERRAVVFHRLNTEDMLEYRVLLPNGDPSCMRLVNRTRELELSEVTGAYYRRPLPPEIPHNAPSTASYMQAEWSAILRSVWNALEGRWLNCPFAILRAEDKPRQLAVARAEGLQVPRTLITNDAEHAKNFLADGAIVAKPLRHALIEDGGAGKVVFTSRIEQDNGLTGIESAPVILQSEVPKRADVRVIVVDDQVFATMIESQAHEETSVDWRKGVRTDLEHRAFTLPYEVEKACVAVTRSLDLRYSAIDLVEDPDGTFWFLEANPNGQWAWIEQRTGARIAEAIVSGLVR